MVEVQGFVTPYPRKIGPLDGLPNRLQRRSSNSSRDWATGDRALARFRLRFGNRSIVTDAARDLDCTFALVRPFIALISSSPGEPGHGSQC
jgi:hypothetical protein